MRHCAVAAGLCWLIGAGAAMAVAPAERPYSAATEPGPEALLIDVYKNLAASQLRQAQQKADALVEAYPNFRLGHLIRIDLLLMHTREITTLGAVAQAPDEKLKNLRDEAMVRLKYLRERPDPSLLPRAVLQLRADQKQALVVDAQHSRLYVYKSEGGQLRLVNDYYVSLGKFGFNKLRQGDQKTPIGIYYITGRLAGARLPDFYGSGALPLNYPNEWNKLQGRSGSGIWLHGTPSDSFSRPPLASDGCVVLANPDLHRFSTSVAQAPILGPGRRALEAHIRAHSLERTGVQQRERLQSSAGTVLARGHTSGRVPCMRIVVGVGGRAFRRCSGFSIHIGEPIDFHLNVCALLQTVCHILQLRDVATVAGAETAGVVVDTEFKIAVGVFRAIHEPAHATFRLWAAADERHMSHFL
jgi:hypothetical protein